LPNIPEDYVHRIGRTGRAGANGEGLFSPDETTFTRYREIDWYEIAYRNIGFARSQSINSTY
jgi:hypothetical protein